MELVDMRRLTLVLLLGLLGLGGRAHATQLYTCGVLGGWDTYTSFVANFTASSQPCDIGWAADVGLLYSNGSSWVIVGTGNGTVTSLSATVPSWLSVNVTNPTTTPAVSITAATGQTANQFLATPNGSSGSVGLRTIASADLPTTIASNTTGNAATATSASSATTAATATALASTPTLCSTGSAPTGVNASGNAVGCAAVPSFGGIGTPNTRSLSLSTAYQATSTAKAAIVNINLSSTASITVSGGTTNTATVYVGTTTGVASGTGTPICSYANSNTGTLTVGLNLSTISTVPCSFSLPASGYFAVVPGTGTVTITSAYDQSLG